MKHTSLKIVLSIWYWYWQNHQKSIH